MINVIRKPEPLSSSPRCELYGLFFPRALCQVPTKLDGKYCREIIFFCTPNGAKVHLGKMTTRSQCARWYGVVQS